MRKIILQILRETTREQQVFDDFVSSLQEYLNGANFEDVKKITLDYNEVMDSIDCNIFFDKKEAIKKGLSFNKIRNHVIYDIGHKLGYFPYKFHLYEHYE